MKKHILDEAPRTLQEAYKLNEVTYLPHYRNSSVYVGPGYPRLTNKTHSADELVLQGAVLVKELLWVRSHHGIVSANNP